MFVQLLQFDWLTVFLYPLNAMTLLWHLLLFNCFILITNVLQFIKSNYSPAKVVEVYSLLWGNKNIFQISATLGKEMTKAHQHSSKALSVQTCLFNKFIKSQLFSYQSSWLKYKNFTAEGCTSHLHCSWQMVLSHFYILLPILGLLPVKNY